MGAQIFVTDKFSGISTAVAECSHRNHKSGLIFNSCLVFCHEYIRILNS